MSKHKGLSAVEVIMELDAMADGSDNEIEHKRADKLVINWLLYHDPASADIAKAWLSARERVGFWYA